MKPFVSVSHDLRSFDIFTPTSWRNFILLHSSVEHDPTFGVFSLNGTFLNLTLSIGVTWETPAKRELVETVEKLVAQQEQRSGDETL